MAIIHIDRAAWASAAYPASFAAHTARANDVAFAIPNLALLRVWYTWPKDVGPRWGCCDQQHGGDHGRCNDFPHDFSSACAPSASMPAPLIHRICCHDASAAPSDRRACEEGAASANSADFGRTASRVRRSAQDLTTGWRSWRDRCAGAGGALGRKSRVSVEEARVDFHSRRYEGGAPMPLLAATHVAPTHRLGAILFAYDIVRVRSTIRYVLFGFLKAGLGLRRLDLRHGASEWRRLFSGHRRMHNGDRGKSKDDETECDSSRNNNRKLGSDGEGSRSSRETGTHGALLCLSIHEYLVRPHPSPQSRYLK